MAAAAVIERVPSVISTAASINVTNTEINTVCGEMLPMVCNRPPLPEALDYLVSSPAVQVTTVPVGSWDGIDPTLPGDDLYYLFEPIGTTATTGYMIFPGGNCDPRGYAPAAHQIAAAGYLTAIIPVPSCVATLGMMRANKIRSDLPQIEKWAIGGHSVGANAATSYAVQSGDIDAVIIWASYPNTSDVFKHLNVKTLVVYGTRDGRVLVDELLANGAVNLPADTVYAAVEGGNHTQFGYIDTSPDPYMQLDNSSTITLEEQLAIIVSSTASFLANLPQNMHMSAYEDCSAQDTFRMCVILRPGVCRRHRVFGPERSL